MWYSVWQTGRVILVTDNRLGRRTKGQQRRRLSPSREGYEARHPTLSFRLTEDLKAPLEEARGAGLSIADVLRTGLGLVQADLQRAREEYAGGYIEAAETFTVAYPCSICGEEILLDTDEEKEVAASLMTEAGWGHSRCHDSAG